MDSQRFDALTRRLGGAGSRRRVLFALVAGAFGHVRGNVEADEVAAACKGFNAKCKSSSSCCAEPGLRCAKHGKRGKRRCRCQTGWKRCAGAGVGCLNVQTDDDNCGDCGNECPPEKPCCFGGACQELCDGNCCADCFVELDIAGNPDLDDPVCCLADGGTICGPNKKKTSDDRCCYPEEECVKGKCCCDGCRGSVVCGGKCCAEAACCNGKCCEQGKVCALTPDGDKCVSANRECVPGEPTCFADEECHGGVCCSEERRCGDGELVDEVCCAAGEYCEMPNNECCPINTFCGAGSFKGHRVRR